jgi:hypothetical protein
VQAPHFAGQGTGQGAFPRTHCAHGHSWCPACRLFTHAIVCMQAQHLFDLRASCVHSCSCHEVSVPVLEATMFRQGSFLTKVEIEDSWPCPFCAARTLGMDLQVGAYHAGGRPSETRVSGWSCLGRKSWARKRWWCLP